VETNKKLSSLYTNPHVTLKWGDHAKTLERIVEYFTKASAHVDNPAQAKYIEEYKQHFLTGNLELHKDSQRTWVKDRKPAVEMMFGFVEPYRDPYGTRAEFEGIVSIVDAEATKVLDGMVAASEIFIPLLPCVQGQQDVGGRNGPFEKDLPELPDFTAIHGTGS
jgi:dipeptidyl-peptidase-3